MGISHGDLALAEKVSDFIAKHPHATCGEVRAKFALSEAKLARLYAHGIIIVLPETAGE